MSLNPGISSSVARRIHEEELAKSFNSGSPYFDMYRCGLYGVPLEDCVSKCRTNGIAVRKKDVQAWEDGMFKHNMKMSGQDITTIARTELGVPVDDAKLSDFPLFPQGWKGTERRFFPCSNENKPLVKWGWSSDFTPQLYMKSDAAALSPCGWVGQNMLYQKFIVVDIDGHGHGEDDQQVIEFGRKFSNITLTMEDPTKPGSFHLYFSTDRLIPVRHYGWAKLDLMGNAVNAAVYMKNKKSNGLLMQELDDEIWNAIMAYQKNRKEI